MDKLSHMICEKVDEGSWIGTKAGQGAPMISHLMFADDLLLFGQATMNQLNCMLGVIKDFCRMSGQQVNYSKTSMLFSDTVTYSVRRDIIAKSGFKEVQALGKYLGVPLTGKTPNKSDYHYLIEQVQRKLAGWKARQLSRAGQVTLARPVIQAIPIYPMLAAALPKSVLQELEKIQRSFIWGEEEGQRRLHHVSWDVLTKSKSIGGLGLRKLSQMNTTCLLKLGWDLKCNTSKLWCQDIQGKYNKTAVENSSWIHKSFDSSFWRALASLENFFQQHEYWSLGDSKKINAWSTRWLLKEAAVTELGISVPTALQNYTVADLVNESGEWDFESLVDWLPEEIIAYMHAIPPPTNTQDQDIYVWPTSPNGSYRVADGYKILCNLHDTVADPNWKHIWRLETTERVRHHIWLIYHDKLLTNARKSRMHTLVIQTATTAQP